MASKVTKKTKPEGKGADDLAVLLPDGVLTFGKKQIVVREYTLSESLLLRAVFAPLVESLRDAGDRLNDLDGILDVLAAHHDTVMQLVAVACDQPEDWVRGLGNADGETLLFTWWVVNADFFVRQLRRLAQKAAAQKASAGQTSSQPSPPTDTTQNDLPTTQPAS
jgi:hypothetical protein